MKNTARILYSVLILLASGFVILFATAPQSFAISVSESSPQPFGSTVHVGGCTARQNTFDSIYIYSPASAGEIDYNSDYCSNVIGSDPITFDYNKYTNGEQNNYGPGTYTFVELTDNSCSNTSTLTAARACPEYAGEASFTFTTPSCTVTVSPAKIDVGATTDVNFHISNNGQTPFEWIKIDRPSGNFTLEGVGGDGSEFVNGIEIPAGTSFDELLSVAAGTDVADSANWMVIAADNPNGDNPTTCVGNLGTAITVHENPLTILNVTITNTSATSETIAWNTNVEADSNVLYGPTSDYGFEGSDATLSTSHSITLTDLSEDTTYKFYVQSTDGSSNTARSTEAAFTTTSAAATTTTVVTTTVTNTVTVTPTPGPTPVPDRIPPTVYLTTDFTKPFLKDPQISGKASDNKDVASISYSLDDGKNWLPVDTITSPHTSATNFSFTPVTFEDGNYNLRVRAKDSAGNIGTSDTYILIIDRLPPQIGAVLFSAGPQILVPDKDGIIFTFPNIEQKITLSAVGGPTSIDIVTGKETDNAASPSAKDLTTYPLIKNIDNGLWSGILSFPKAGIYELTAKAIDGAKNKTERKLNTIVVLDSGKILNGSAPVTSGQVALWYLDNQTQRFALWDGESYGQANPQTITNNGEYGFFAPAGTYYLEVKSFGFKTLRTEIFTLNETTPILADLKLEKSLSFNLGSLTIPLPDFSVSKQSVNIESRAVPAGAKLTDNIVGVEPPNVDIFLDSQNISMISFAGKPTVLTFLSTWSPYASEQLKYLGEFSANSQINVVPVISQETATSVTVFRKRGGYPFPIYSDPDGLLVKPFNLSFLPTSIFIDRKGVIQKVKVGVLTMSELLENVVN